MASRTPKRVWIVMEHPIREDLLVAAKLVLTHYGSSGPDLYGAFYPPGTDGESVRSRGYGPRSLSIEGVVEELVEMPRKSWEPPTSSRRGELGSEPKTERIEAEIVRRIGTEETES